MTTVPVGTIWQDNAKRFARTREDVEREQAAKRATADMRKHLERHDVAEWLTRTPELHPAEAIALTAALGPVMRGETPGENTALMCVLALARLMGRHDWRKQ